MDAATRAIFDKNPNVARVMVHHNVWSLDDLPGKGICCRGSWMIKHYGGIIKDVDMKKEQWIFKGAMDYKENERKAQWLTLCDLCEEHCGPYRGPPRMHGQY